MPVIPSLILLQQVLHFSLAQVQNKVAQTIYITTKLMPLIDKVRNVVKEVVIPEDVVGRDIKVMIDGLIKAAIEEHTSN